VLVKGGHLDSARLVDVLFDGVEFLEFPVMRVDTVHTHGTGCTYSAAVAALLASGFDLAGAVGRAKAFIDLAIRTGPGLGGGQGPVNHFAATDGPPLS
jgi:hydroxymethylpyrimidine/phosphomethylpyrimidine kinase